MSQFNFLSKDVNFKKKKEERKDGGEKKAPSILHGGIWFTQVNQSTVVSVLYAVSIKLQKTQADENSISTLSFTELSVWEDWQQTGSFVQKKLKTIGEVRCPCCWISW